MSFTRGIVSGTLYWHDDLNRLHRLGGPAVEEPDSTSTALISESWYIHGVRLTPEEHAYYSKNLVEFELEYGDQL